MSWQVDNTHTQIQFVVRHMMIAKVRGIFEKFDIQIDLDETQPENTSVKVQVETASINTREPQRDAHLRSADFFNSENTPYMTFESRKVDMLDSHHARLHGNLTIRDMTRPITIDVEYSGQAQSPWGTVSAGFSGHAVISRKDWGLTWNQALETGGVLVSDEVEINIELEVVKQREAEAETAA
jgi:polyisoprenoid-binding protein YceI